MSMNCEIEIINSSIIDGFHYEMDTALKAADIRSIKLSY